MADPVRILDLGDARALTEVEYLVANGLGGFSSSTVPGTLTRRYHGVLVAALPSPFGRTVMLNQLQAFVRLPGGGTVPLEGEDGQGALFDFRLELGLPVWRYRAGGVVIEKRIVMRHLHNTVDVIYRHVEGEPVSLTLRPWIWRRSGGRPSWAFTSQRSPWAETRSGSPGTVSTASSWPRKAIHGRSVSDTGSPSTWR